MKKQILNLATFVLLLAGFIACDKNDEYANIDFSNIENLCEQPIPVIERIIQGKWKVVYYKGGLISNMIQYPDNRFEEFISDKNYTYTTSEGTITTKFEWDTEQSYYTKEASMYILKYGNRSLVMENIHNDTLVFHDQHMIDGMSSYCIKIN